MKIDWYLFWGFVSSATFLSSVPAIWHQLAVIWKRKRQYSEQTLGERPTHSISLNQIFSSFCGVYSFFLFGFVLDSPDPFLVYPRAIVGILIYLILLELHLDRRSSQTFYALIGSSGALLVPLALWAFGMRTVDSIRSFSQAIVFLATVLMAQGAISQYQLLKKNRARGAVSLPMHATLYLKDFSGLMFGLQIGASAWTIILMHLSNLIMRAPIIVTYLRLPH